MNNINQTKPNPFTAFGTPSKFYLNGNDITNEVISTGIDLWLYTLAAFFNTDVKAFAISRINGAVKLYVSSVNGGAK